MCSQADEGAFNIVRTGGDGVAFSAHFAGSDAPAGVHQMSRPSGHECPDTGRNLKPDTRNTRMSEHQDERTPGTGV